MKKRITVLLNNTGPLYKSLSAFQNNSDARSYIYQHMKDEKSSVTVANSLHLLRASCNFSTDGIDKRLEKDGDRIHLSLHPNRIYLKRSNTTGSKEHLIEEYEPQPFNKDGFKLHVIYTPPPITHMEEYRSKPVKNSLEEIIFDWDSDMCPQVSIYELSENFPLGDVEKTLPPASKLKSIASDGTHPTLVLHLRTTDGDPGVWRPQCGIFGKVVKKKPISKGDLQKIIEYNGLKIDISSLPDNAIISDYKMENADKL